MTKQEEIREELASHYFYAARPLGSWSSTSLKNKLTARNNADKILFYLHSRGCVIKVDRELPDNKIMRQELEDERHKGEVNWYYKAQLDIVRAGFTAFEPLISERT